METDIRVHPNGVTHFNKILRRAGFVGVNRVIVDGYVALVIRHDIDLPTALERLDLLRQDIAQQIKMGVK